MVNMTKKITPVNSHPLLWLKDDIADFFSSIVDRMNNSSITDKIIYLYVAFRLTSLVQDMMKSLVKTHCC